MLLAALLAASCSTIHGATPSGADPNGPRPTTAASSSTPAAVGDAARALEQLPVKGRSPRTGYTRSKFGDRWAEVDGCDVRDRVLAQQLTHVRFDPAGGGRCIVAEGDLTDPYVPRPIHFVRSGQYVNSIDIDHVVALQDAWQTGAQQLTAERRAQFANDARNLLAVDPSANRQKGDGDAASWLPPNTSFRCTYATRQITVKAAYALWITPAEKAALHRALQGCPTR